MELEETDLITQQGSSMIKELLEDISNKDEDSCEEQNKDEDSCEEDNKDKDSCEEDSCGEDNKDEDSCEEDNNSCPEGNEAVHTSAGQPSEQTKVIPNYFITKWNKSYFDFETALKNKAVFSKRLTGKVKIGDILIVMFTKKGGIRYTAQVLSEPYHYIDKDEYETQEGKEKLRSNRVIGGVNIRLNSSIDIDDTQVREKFESLNFSYKGPWVFKRITKEAYEHLTTN